MSRRRPVLSLLSAVLAVALGAVGSASAASAAAPGLGTPTITSTTPNGTQYVDLTWTPVAKATRYEVRWSAEQVSGTWTFATASTSGTAGPTYPGDTMTLEVRALTAKTSSAWSAPVTAYTRSDAPGNLFASAVRPDLVDLVWQPGSGNLSWEVDVLGADGSLTPATVVETLGDSHVTLAAVADTTYRYVVVGIGPGGLRSEPSYPVELTTPARWQPQIYLGPSGPLPAGSVTLTANVSGGVAYPASGTVSLWVDDGDRTEAVLVDGTASVSVVVAAGEHVIRTAYSGDGAFEPATSSTNLSVYPVVPATTVTVLGQEGGTSSDVAAGDVNGDGRQDLAGLVVGEASSQLVLRPGLGDGTFAAPQVRTVPATCTHVDVGRLDAGAAEDVVLGCTDGLRVLAGSATGLSSPQLVRTDAPTVDLVVADLAGDALEDIAYSTPTALRVLPSAGRLRFGKVQTVSTGQAVNELRAADADADGRADLAGNAAPDMEPSAAVVWVARSGVWRELYRSDFVSGGLSSFTDVTGDGRADLVVRYLSDDESVVVLVMQPDGSVVRRAVPSPRLSIGPTAVGDVDGDGTLDLVATPYGTSEASLWQLTDPVSPRTPVDLGSSYQVIEALAVDLDADGRSEVVMVDPGVGLLVLAAS